MSQDNRISLPSGQGGLSNYSRDYKSKLEIPPVAVIVICVAIILLIIILHQIGGSFFQ